MLRRARRTTSCGARSTSPRWTCPSRSTSASRAPTGRTRTPQDADGYVWFHSRKDDVINSAGYRIGPGEIEDCLGGHPAVAMSAVIGVPDERRGEVPTAFVVPRDDAPPDRGALADALRSHVRERLAPHEVPREIVFVEDLTHTTTGKIMRRALRDG